MKRKIILASLLIIVQMACITAAQSGIPAVSGKWDIVANGYPGTITFDGGRIYIADKTNGEALTGINFDGKVIRFHRNSILGHDSDQDYTGEVSGDTMTGTFTEVNTPGTIYQWSASRTNVYNPTVVNNPQPVSNVPTENQPQPQEQPLDIKLVVRPEIPTDVDVVEIEAEVSGDYKEPLSYVWSKDNVLMQGETGYKIRLESGVLPGDYQINVQVTDNGGRTGDASTTLNVIEGNTGIRGDVLEAISFDPIPNATVSATSLASGVTKTVPVDSDGKYSIHLMPGHYRVSASSPGYITESGTFGDDVKVLSPHDEPYCTDCYTTFNFRLVETSQISHSTLNPGSIWNEKEYGAMGNWDGIWTVSKDGLTIDASWSGGRITDVIEIRSIKGNQITLYRYGNMGTYTGTISPDGLSMSGTASWYPPGETWAASTNSPGRPLEPITSEAL